MVDVDLIPKEYKRKREEISTIFSKLGGVVLILFILSLLLYGGLLLYQNRVNKNIDTIKEEISILEQEINQTADKETKEGIIALDENLDILKLLFENHLYWSKLFSKIEKLTVPEAYFSEAKISFLEDKVNLIFSGNVLSYTILAKQMISFQEESSVENVKVSGISLSNEGGINFDLEIIFSKDILLNHE